LLAAAEERAKMISSDDDIEIPPSPEMDASIIPFEVIQ
jgi:hypothetical protein